MFQSPGLSRSYIFHFPELADADAARALRADQARLAALAAGLSSLSLSSSLALSLSRSIDRSIDRSIYLSLSLSLSLSLFLSLPLSVSLSLARSLSLPSRSLFPSLSLSEHGMLAAAPREEAPAGRAAQAGYGPKTARSAARAVDASRRARGAGSAGGGRLRPRGDSGGGAGGAGRGGKVGPARKAEKVRNSGLSASPPKRRGGDRLRCARKAQKAGPVDDAPVPPGFACRSLPGRRGRPAAGSTQGRTCGSWGHADSTQGGMPRKRYGNGTPPTNAGSAGELRSAGMARRCPPGTGARGSEPLVGF